MKLASLFERLPRSRSLAAELDAVAARTKALAYFASHRDVVEDGSDLIPIMRGAFARGLAVTMVPRGTRVELFVLPAEESWRIPAFQTFVESTTTWSWDAEEQQGILLGYSAKERAAHIAQLRSSRIGFGFITAYAILPRGRTAIERGTDVFFPREPQRVTPAARKKLRAGTQLVRFGIAAPALRSLVGDARSWGRIVSATIDQPLVLAAPVEVLGARGWLPT